MKLDVLKVIGGIMRVMSVVEKIKSAKGSEKLEVVVNETPELVEAIEAGIDRDILRDEKVVEAEIQMIAGIKAFQNAVQAAKDARLPRTN